MSIPSINPNQTADAAKRASNIRQTVPADNTGAFSTLMRMFGKTGNATSDQAPLQGPFATTNSTTDPVDNALRRLTDKTPTASQTAPATGAPPRPTPNAVRLPVDRTFLSPVESVKAAEPASAATNSTAAPNATADATPAAESGKANQPCVPSGVLWKYESGHNGAEAIGYDRHGGTSYGRYQISSRSGSMRRFVSYLKEMAPDLAGRLAKAGPSDTGGRNGRMPDEWRKITNEDPQRFESLQHDFIRRTHYEPARQQVLKKCGLDVENRSPALREVLWSMAIQHGANGAAHIFRNAVKPSDLAVGKNDREIITSVYDARIQRFSKASPSLRSALKSRYLREASQILETHDSSSATVI